MFLYNCSILSNSAMYKLNRFQSRFGCRMRRSFHSRRWSNGIRQRMFGSWRLCIMRWLSLLCGFSRLCSNPMSLFWRYNHSRPIPNPVPMNSLWSTLFMYIPRVKHDGLWLGCEDCILRFLLKHHLGSGSNKPYRLHKLMRLQVFGVLWSLSFMDPSTHNMRLEKHWEFGRNPSKGRFSKEFEKDCRGIEFLTGSHLF